MMGKITTYLVLIIALLALSLAGCATSDPNQIAPLANEVYALQLGSTLQGMQRAIAEKPGTLLMQKGDLYLFVWSLKDAWGFVSVTAKQLASPLTLKDLAGGNLVNAKTMTDLYTCLEKNGWEIIGASQLPSFIKTSVAVTAQVWGTLSSSLTTFLVMPAGVFATTDMLEEYQTIKEWQ